MTHVFKPILERMAAGDLEHVYADAVIHIDKEEIVWDQINRQTGTISIYSNNDVPVMGTVLSLHPAVVVKESCFQGNTIIHYECLPESVLFFADSVQEGILICCNGKEFVIPIRFQTADSVEMEIEKKQLETSPSVDSSKRQGQYSVSEDHRRLRHTQAQFTRKIMELFSCKRLENNPEKLSRLIREAGSMVQILIQ